MTWSNSNAPIIVAAVVIESNDQNANLTTFVPVKLHAADVNERTLE